MEVFKVEECMPYKSITGFVFEKYFYNVAQFNKNNELIV